MIRVKDAEKSLKFYQEVLGMSLLRAHDNKDAGFSLYFLAYTRGKGVPAEGESTADREGILELTWNHGTEKDENFKYHNGNSPDREGRQGFGHICKLTPLVLGGQSLTVQHQASPSIILKQLASDSTNSMSHGRNACPTGG